jgi:two-component system sensor histidine kinase YesM
MVGWIRGKASFLFWGKSINYRIFVMTATFMAVALIVSTQWSMNIFSDSLESKAKENMGNILEQTNKLIDMRISGILNTSNLIFNDPNMITLFDGISRETSPDEYYLTNTANPIINKYVLSDPSIVSIMLVNKKKNWFIPSADFDYYATGVSTFIQHYYTYAEEYFTRGIIWVPSHPIDYSSKEHSHEKIIKLVRDIYDQKIEYAATMIINISERSISDLFRNVNTPDSTVFYVIDQDSHVISGTDQLQLNDSEEAKPFLTAAERQDGSMIAEFRGKPHLFVFHKLVGVDWISVGAVPVEEMLKDRNKIVSGIRIFVLFLLIISIIGTWVLSYSITKPIRKLSGIMRDVKAGNLDIKVEIHTRDEIGMLGHSFNLMLQRVGELLHQLKESHDKEKQAEIRALQANINPHFLYNTLESVIWLAESKDYEEITELISKLGKYYRLSLSRGMEIVKIKDELAHAEHYLAIERIRHGDKFIYEIEVESEILEYECLKLILQPLVENALHHGILHNQGKGMISIRGRKEGEAIVLTIQDNGQGIAKSRLDEINELFRSGRSFELPSSYGIKNVNERLQLKYGMDCGLFYRSEEGTGTLVEVRKTAKKNDR